MTEQIRIIFAEKLNYELKTIMKTLSVQQPWATLICAGIKDVENRTWKTAKVPGKILIHASSKKVTRNFFDTIPYEWEAIIMNHIMMGNLAPLKQLPTSAIIGYVTVTGFEEGMTDSIWDGGPAQIKWKLEDAWLFKEPITDVKGKLNLFDYDLDENNLPPAEKAIFLNIHMEDGKLVLPVMDGTIDDIDNKVIENVDFNEVPGITDILFVNKDSDELKSFKTVILQENYKRAEYELTEKPQIFYDALSDDENDNSVRTAILMDGTEIDVRHIVFSIGKKLSEK